MFVWLRRLTLNPTTCVFHLPIAAPLPRNVFWNKTSICPQHSEDFLSSVCPASLRAPHMSWSFRPRQLWSVCSQVTEHSTASPSLNGTAPCVGDALFVVSDQISSLCLRHNGLVTGVVSRLHIHGVDMPMLNDKQRVNGILWKLFDGAVCEGLKSRSCLYTQASTAGAGFCECACVLACVSETTIAGLSAAWARRRTMLAGRCAWIKLCIGSLLRLTPPPPASLTVCATCPPQSSHPTSTPGLCVRVCGGGGGGWKDGGRHHCEHCVVLFCEARTALAALYLSLHTLCSAIYRLAFGNALRQWRLGGGWGVQALQVVNGSTMDRWSVQDKSKCKQGEEIFFLCFKKKATS